MHLNAPKSCLLQLNNNAAADAEKATLEPINQQRQFETDLVRYKRFLFDFLVSPSASLALHHLQSEGKFNQHVVLDAGRLYAIISVDYI